MNCWKGGWEVKSDASNDCLSALSQSRVPAAPRRAQWANGHMSGHQRYRCLGCGAWFGETQGTPLYRLRTPPEAIANARCS